MRYPSSLSCARCLAVASLAFLAATGCSRLPAGTGSQAVRVASVDPDRIADAAELLSGDVLGSWDLTSPAGRVSWRLVDLEVVPNDEGVGVRLKSTSTDPKVIGPVEFAAAEASSIEVEIEGAYGPEVRLFWAGAGEPFTADRQLVVSKGGAEKVVRFFVANHPRWTGRIARIRLDPTNRDDAEFSIGTIRAKRRLEHGSGDGVAQSLYVKVDLDGDARSSIVTYLGGEFEASLAVARGSMLRFALAWLGVEGAPPVATVKFTSEDGEETTVFSEVASARDAARRWIDHEVDLGALGPGRYTVRFGVQQQAAGGATLGAAAWANPDVLSPAAAGPAPNVLLIVVDTLRASSMSLYGNERPTTPFLDSWSAADATVFDYAIAPSPWTKPSHTSLFSGLETLNHEVNFEERVPEQYTLLAEVFRDAGYRTIAVTGGGYLRPGWGFAQGFDVFKYWEEEGTEGEFAAGLASMETFVNEAAKTGRSSFWFFHTYEVHAPYHGREPYFDHFLAKDEATTPSRRVFTTRQTTSPDGVPLFRLDHYLVEPGAGAEGRPLRVAPGDIPTVVAAYESGIATVDDGLRQLFQLLEASGLYDDTIIVVTSDHGESFGEHGDFAHSSLYDTVLHVPLIVKGTGRTFKPGRVESQVRLIDVAPTVLELAGLPPLPAADGRSLRELMASPEETDHRDAWSYAGSSNFGVSVRIANTTKAILPYSVWRGVAGFEPKVFDLGKDPQEMQNLATQGPVEQDPLAIVAERLRRRRAGLRVTVGNHLDVPYEAAFKGKDAGIYRVKSTGAPPDNVAWVVGRGLVVTVRPGSSMDLVFDGYVGGRVDCQLSAPGGSRVVGAFELSRTSLANGVVIGWSGSDWSDGWKPDDRPAAMVTAVVESSAVDSEEAILEDDELEQLKALGYIQ